MKWSEFDFSKLEQLSGNLQEMQAAIPGFMEDCVKELALELLSRTVRRTPVDTGVLRQAWQIGAIQRAGDRYEVEIFNPTKYASSVEYGYLTEDRNNWVDGRFMLTVSTQEMEKKLPAIVGRKLRNYLQKYLGK